MEKKENQRITLTKRLLKESLLQLMEKESIQKISVLELCQAAEINRTTFYRHYGSPFDLLKEIETDMVMEMDQIWEKECSKRDWSSDKWIEPLCYYLEKNKQVMKRFIYDHIAASDMVRLILNSVHAQEIFAKLLVDVENQDDRELIKAFITGGMQGILSEWIFSDSPRNAKEVGKLISRLLRHNWKA